MCKKQFLGPVFWFFFFCPLLRMIFIRCPVETGVHRAVVFSLTKWVSVHFFIFKVKEWKKSCRKCWKEYKRHETTNTGCLKLRLAASECCNLNSGYKPPLSHGFMLNNNINIKEETNGGSLEKLKVMVKLNSLRKCTFIWMFLTWIHRTF